MEENMSAVVDPVIEEPAPVAEEPVVEVSTAEPVEPEAAPAATEDPAAASEEPIVENPGSDFKKNEDEDDNGEGSEKEPAKDEDEDEDEKKKYSLLESQHNELQSTYSALENQYVELQNSYAALETSYKELVEFKRQIDDAKKDQMIESFYMLSDEEKAEITARKAQYTVEEIEEKLSVICFRKGNFDSSNTSNDNKTEAPVMTFSVHNAGASKPAWLSAVDNVKNNRN